MQRAQYGDSKRTMLNLIPYPTHIEPMAGYFELDGETVMIADAHAHATAVLLAEWLRPATGFELPVLPTSTMRAITLRLIQPRTASEAYELHVSSSQILLTASSEAGLFYAAQTLRQLLPVDIFSQHVQSELSWRVPNLKVIDSPRFGWRGAHLDVARHFMPLNFLKKFVDGLAMLKYNVFHLHLTEDQGWRIHIHKYPLLTEIGAWRETTRTGHERDPDRGFDNIRHGGFYTQADLRELVTYAAQRHITIVPEIEMPGHAQAAIAAYPELGNVPEELDVRANWGISKHVFNAGESTIVFLQDVLEEVLDIFPGKYIHVGGDECPKDEWKASSLMQARMTELGLKDEHELQSYFIRRMDTWLAHRGRVLVGWDEILEGGLAESATVMSWRGEAGGIAAAKAGHDVVMAPNTFTYFDYLQSADKTAEPLGIGGFLPLEKVYSYDPIPAELDHKQASHVLGTQFQLWTEYMSTPGQVEYMTYPRACALAEVAWSALPRQNYSDFVVRVQAHMDRLDQLGINHRRTL